MHLSWSKASYFSELTKSKDISIWPRGSKEYQTFSLQKPKFQFVQNVKEKKTTSATFIPYSYQN